MLKNTPLSHLYWNGKSLSYYDHIHVIIYVKNAKRALHLVSICKHWSHFHKDIMYTVYKIAKIGELSSLLLHHNFCPNYLIFTDRWIHNHYMWHKTILFVYPDSKLKLPTNHDLWLVLPSNFPEISLFEFLKIILHL